MSTKILLCFDFGTKNIGIAVGQLFTGNVRPLNALKAQDGTPDWMQIEKLLKEWQPDYLVVGLPLNMDGSEQYLTSRVRKFARCLHDRFDIRVELQDERLSTVEARYCLFERGGYRALNKYSVDSHAAAIILQDWLEIN
ncbi:Holliday junction resolvase RuvX [Pantoea sp. Nvir]|uniref:Holliday junction resolvase RuvX n=1 Tax=Pantoea sp. Nvir TaxID=2576760 RepID=UPI00135B64A0|nr:Holliday junction resolvase RuvX [Pantoea sp. Nvir]MXP66759.1 Holliday junction resolvase RuvX [Pantoea sp. Nvir]